MKATKNGQNRAPIIKKWTARGERSKAEITRGVIRWVQHSQRRANGQGMPWKVGNTWTESSNLNMSSQKVRPRAAWRQVANGMAAEKGKLWLACNSFKSHSSLLSNCPANLPIRQFQRLQLPASSTQWCLRAPLRFSFLHHKEGTAPKQKLAPRADLVTFLRDCTLAPPFGQCLKTVVSCGLSSFV